MAATIKVLLVTGNPLFLEQMKSYLRQFTVSLVTADSAAAALSMANSQPPGMIFMEMDLPGQSGVECCWKLRHDPRFARTHIVLITPDDRDDDYRICLAARCTTVLSKPLKRREFIEVFRELQETIERREPRLPCRATAACHSGKTTFYGTIEDVSVHGIFIGTPQTVRSGDRLQVKFLLPWHQATLIETPARVTWINSGRKSKLPPGFGLEFVDLPPAVKSQLDDFMTYSQLRLNPPDDW